MEGVAKKRKDNILNEMLPRLEKERSECPVRRFCYPMPIGGAVG